MSNFVYWKVRTTTYLQSLGAEVWDIVEGGYTFPSATPTDTTSKKQYETNAKVINTLLGSLFESEFIKVMQLKTTKQIWDKIILSYEGDDQVKRAKLQSLRIQYETLRMHNNESVANYILHIDEIVNHMKNLGPSDIREATFKTSKGEYNESGHTSEGEEESSFVKNLQRGSGRFIGKLHFKCFTCGRVGHYAAKCPHKDKLDKDDDLLDAVDEEDLCEEIYKLKIRLEEKSMIIDTLTFQLAEREKHNEKLECEIMGPRKDIEKTKALNLRFSKGSETLDEIIKVQQSPLIKTGLGYTEEASQAQKPSTSKSYLNAARKSEQVDNRQQRHKADQQVNHSQFSSRMNVYGNYNHLDDRFDNCRNFLNGQCFSCHNFGHKATQSVSYKTIMTREARNQRSVTGIMKRTYNNFSALENEIECSICNNFSHEDSECRSKFWQSSQKEQPSLGPKTWRKKEPQPERCGIALYAEGQENQWYIDSGCSKHMTGDKEKLQSYSALEKEMKVSFGNDTPALIKGKGSVLLKEKVKAGNVMYVDGLKHNLLSVSQMCDQGNEIIFRSNGCKGSVLLKEKVKAGNVMYVDGLKHNLLSVSQMCDQGNEIIFRSNGCIVCELDTGETMIKGIRTLKNLYILKGGQQQCYLSKNDEHWLWHRRLGNLSFS
eukprot:PITA_10531